MSKNSIRYKEIPGFPNYKVGTDGTVWRFRLGRKRAPTPRWKQLKTPPDRSNGGRPVVNIGPVSKTRRRFVARLVLETFVGPCPTNQECCHFPDRNPKNNNLENLRWGTSKENNRHQYIHGTRVMGESHPQCKLSDKQVKELRSFKRKLKGYEIARKFNISQGYVSMLLNDFRRRHA